MQLQPAVALQHAHVPRAKACAQTMERKAGGPEVVPPEVAEPRPYRLYGPMRQCSGCRNEMGWSGAREACTANAGSARYF